MPTKTLLVSFLVALSLLPASSAMASLSPSAARTVLSNELRFENAGNGKKSCALMSESYQELYLDIAVMIGSSGSNCQEIVPDLTAWRRKVDKDFSSKSRRELKAVKKSKVVIEHPADRPTQAVVSFKYRGTPPGWKTERGKTTHESYLLVAVGKNWRVDAITQIKVTP